MLEIRRTKGTKFFALELDVDTYSHKYIFQLVLNLWPGHWGFVLYTPVN